MHSFWKKVTEEHSPGVHRSCGRINTLCSHLKTRFKINLDQNMLKNALFSGKIRKNRRSVWGPAPKPPLSSGGWGGPPPNPPTVSPPFFFSYATVRRLFR